MDHIVFAHGGTNVMTTHNTYDPVNRLISRVSLAPGTAGTNTPGTTPASFQYQYNAAGRRTRLTLADGSYWIYQYDALGQLTNGTKYFLDGTPYAGQQFQYTLDSIGNRLSTLAGGDSNGMNLRTNLYTNNLLNQITSRTFPGYVDVMGLTLTWNNRLGNLGNVDVYNFYSSGEQVLRTYTNTGTPSFVGLIASIIVQNVWHGRPHATYVWCWQELEKGQFGLETVLGSTHGGWQFNTSYLDYYLNVSPPSWPACAPPSLLLVTNPLFDKSFDTQLYTADSSGSGYAQNNRNRILSDAIPAVTLPMGANQVPGFRNSHNIDMMTLENAWPRDRMRTSEKNNWHHGDFQDVAYTFSYQLYNNMVEIGNLK